MSRDYDWFIGWHMYSIVLIQISWSLKFDIERTENLANFLSMKKNRPVFFFPLSVFFHLVCFLSRKSETLQRMIYSES